MGLAILAAAVNAGASVLQRKAARGEPAESSFSIALLWGLVHRPVWVAGIVTVLVGFLLQAAALDNGPIALVQPLLVLELPFTLLLVRPVLGGHLGAREWLAALTMAAGLAMLLFALQPHGGHPGQVALAVWLLGIAVSGAVVGVLIWMAQHRRTQGRAVMLGVATGVAFGLTAVLVKATTVAFTQQGIMGVLAAWQTYLVVVIGPASFFLLQNALQAGSLVASQPGMTLANPATATAWGVAVFSEEVQGGAWLVLAVAGAAVIVAGTVPLAHSPLLGEPADTVR